jgi:hypothetical protein
VLIQPIGAKQQKSRQGVTMVAALRSLIVAVVDRSSYMLGRPKPENEVPKIGAYPVDYSEPTQEEVAAANASCEDLFKTGDWVSVNRKS